MNVRQQILKSPWIYLCVLALIVGFGDLAYAGTTANLALTCGSADFDLPAATALPVVSANTNPGVGGIDTTACGINQANQNGLKCFTPQNNCTVTLTGQGGAAPLNTRVAIASGACSATPAVCTGSGATNTLNAVLLAGTQYCIYVETTTNQLIGYNLTASGGTNCGTLPVELIEFSVDGEPGAEN